MTSANEDTPRKLKSKKDPLRFLPPGLYFRGKFIGIEHVADACGDRSDMMCQVAMAKMKAAIKTLGDHKRKIVINISTNGIKILDEKDEDMIFDHPLSRISYISRDISDSRAFGYVFNPGLDCHEFYGIKTEKAADVVVSTLRDLFYNTEYNRNNTEFNKNNTSLPEDSNQLDQSWRMPSPPFSLKYGGFAEGGTLGRFKKSPHLLYRFYNTVSNTPLPASPRKQAGFLTLYNRHSTATAQPPSASTIHQPDISSSVAMTTPSLSSSSSSNQNVNNSPSASAVKSPLSVITSKKSLSSISSLPVIESPPNSPATFKVQNSGSPESSGMNAEQTMGNDDLNKEPNEIETKLSEEIETLMKADAAEDLRDPNQGNHGTFEETRDQLSWANFEEFEFSDESPVEGSVAKKTTKDDDSQALRTAKMSEFDSNYQLSEGTASSGSRNPSLGSAFKNSNLVLSFNGIDPFVDDPFFSKDIDISFDSFKIDGNLSEFESITLKEEGRSTWMNCSDFGEEVVSPTRHEEVDFKQINFDAPQLNDFEDTFFYDNFAPELQEESWRIQNESREEPNEYQPHESPRFDEVSKVEVQCNQVPFETPRINLPSMNLKPIMLLKAGLAGDSSPTSPSTNPSEFPSPDIPPPPLPPEATSISPLQPTPPPLPPRRPHKRDGNVSTELESFPQISRLGGLRSENNSSQKLDTASILRLYSVSATSYFGSKNSNPSPSTSDVHDDEEPTYGNTHSIFVAAKTNDDVYSSENLESPTSCPRSFHLVPPRLPDRKLSPTLNSFHSYSLTDHASQNGQNLDKESISFSRSLDEPVV